MAAMAQISHCTGVSRVPESMGSLMGVRHEWAIMNSDWAQD